MPQPSDRTRYDDEERIPESLVQKFLSQAMAYRELPADEVSADS